MAALKAAKQELRQHIRRAISDIPAESIVVQSVNASKTILSLPEYQNAKRISVYLSMPAGEINTAQIVHDALMNGKKVFVPYTHKQLSKQAQLVSVMDMLSLHSVADYESFKPDKWGIPTPGRDSISARENCLGARNRPAGKGVGIEEGQGGLDLIVMPGMAFDCEMRRLGHGKGYYDFFLQTLRENNSSNAQEGVKMPFLVGLALQEQLLPEGDAVPTDANDWPLDGLVIGDGRYLRRGSSWQKV